jgi:purine-binding chemotaxis protein CheW
MNQAVASPSAASPTTPANWGAADAARSAAAPTQFISFAIGDDQYGVDIMAVREIKGWSEITHLPKQPEYVRGVLNLRGVIVPIIDLRCRFGQGVTEATSLHIVIIVQVGLRPVGLLADRVLDIVSFEPTQVQPVPRIAQASRVDFLSGLVTVDGAMLALIDLQNLLAVTMTDSGEEASSDRKRN